MTTVTEITTVQEKETAIPGIIRAIHHYQRSISWIYILDFAILLTILLLFFTEAKIFCFHLTFVLLTIGAFYWQLSAFVLRAGIAVLLTSAAVLFFVSSHHIHVEELVEIPMLTIILLLVFTVARQRARAEENLRKANEALESRVLARTIDLSKEIAERKKTEQTLRESEERYRQLVQLSFEAIAIHTETAIIYLNPAGLKLLGIPDLQELPTKSMLDFVHPDRLVVVTARLQQIAQEGKGAPLTEEKWMRLDGKAIDVETATIPILYQGRPALQTVIRDITIRKQAEQARLEERMNVARDLHDSLGQSLGYLHLKLDEIADRPALQTVSGLTEDLARLRSVANSAYEQVRSLLASLLPANTIHLTQALREKAKSISRQARFQVQVINRGVEGALPAVLQQQLLFLCSEALNNIAKHAAAQEVKIELWWMDSILTITIADDGIGFDPDAPLPDHSYGLRIMHERTAQMTGLLSIQSQKGVGTQLTLQIPLP